VTVPAEIPDAPVGTSLTFYFVGVTTGASSVVRVFPRWMEVLQRTEVGLAGIDHPLHDHADAYRATVDRIAGDPRAVGALVTSHKLDLLAASRDAFDYLDPYAELLQEVSCIVKGGGRLEGYAKDPLSTRLAVDALVGPGYFGATDGHVLCLGAGGAGLATLVSFLDRAEPADRPERFIAVDREPARLDHLRSLADRLGGDIDVEAVLSDHAPQNDALLERLPAASVVINATGMGKDRPGSPLTDEARFPERAIAWDFNYRGELEFLRQARRQRSTRGVRVEDGWVYFLHGWSQVIAQVLGVDLTPELFDRFAEAAVRPAVPGSSSSGTAQTRSLEYGS
jgi:shikimate 5-dehydrogenase